MNEFLSFSLYFGVMLSLAAYAVGLWLKNRIKSDIINPLLISVVIVIAVLYIFRIDYDTYYESAKYLSYLLTPATVCLAIPLYKQLDILKKNKAAIFLGITAGVLASAASIFLLSQLLGFSHELYVTLLPKSITTAMGIDLSEEIGGVSTITVASIILTGIFGNISAPWLCKLFRITSPEARGIAIGTSSHAIGTAKALEMGEVEGAMSSLSIVISGLFTVIVLPILTNLT